MANVKQSESATKKFLLDLLHVTGLFLTSACHAPPEIYLDRKTYEAFCEAHERRVARQALRRLKQQKLIAVKEKGERIEIALTSKGTRKIFAIQLRQIKQKLPPGEYCLVSFDIPQATKRTRDVVREFLKELGFKIVHQSVWISRLDIDKPLKEFIKSLHAEKWIRVFRIREE